VTALFTGFEMGMPLAGLVIGQALGTLLGQVADYVAIALLAVVGVYLLWPRREEDEEAQLERLVAARGITAIGLGLSISLDELAIGFTLGLLRQPLLLVVLLIGLQALIVTQLGLRLGSRLGERVREGAERVAGVVLVLLAAVLLLEHLR
jgi:putative Mn2+ efflux pump MntP